MYKNFINSQNISDSQKVTAISFIENMNEDQYSTAIANIKTAIGDDITIDDLAVIPSIVLLTYEVTSHIDLSKSCMQDKTMMLEFVIYSIITKVIGENNMSENQKFQFDTLFKISWSLLQKIPISKIKANCFCG